MQTFVPYADLVASNRVLDGPRLGKQRVETFQILRALTWPGYAWKNHPAVRMWRGFVPALVRYGVENCREWTRRGNADSVLPQLLAWTGGEVPEDPPMPPWWGWEELHLSHRARLVHKDPEFYRPLFGDLPDLPYLWPPDAFPRWPVRHEGRDLDVDEAAAVLGLPAPQPGQRAAVDAVRAGRDALLVAAPGTGGTTAALLAGLSSPGRTLRLLGGTHPDPAPVPDVPLLPPRVVDPDAAPADRPPAIARPPGIADLAAMAAEAAPTEWLFARPDRLPDPLPDAGLLTVEGDLAAQVLLERGGLPALRPPALVVVTRADAARREELVRGLLLRGAVHTGGGWDVEADLDARPLTGTAARRRALLEVVTGAGGALVVAPDRGRADRAVGTLTAAGLRAALWAPGIRPSRAAAAVGAWRTRRLDALVVPEGELPPLGRAVVRLLVGLDAPGPRTAWRDLVATVRPARAVLLAGPDAPADLRDYAAAATAGGGGCARAALLAPLGEPVPVPCGRCAPCRARLEPYPEEPRDQAPAAASR